MPILNTVSEWYAKAEDKFFSGLDWLESKGVPAYAYSNALESRGIPAFPVTICLILLILFLAAWFLLIPGSTSTSIVLALQDQSDSSLSGVEVTILDSSGKQLFKQTKSHGDSISLSGVAGKELTINAQKDGYENASVKIIVRSDAESASLTLNKVYRSVLSRIRFVDSKSQLPITNADVTLSWQNILRTGKTDENGFFTAQGLPEGEDIRMTVKSDNYEDVDTTVRLAENQIRTIPLEPKDSALFGEASLVIKVFDKETNFPLDDAEIQIQNPVSLASLFEGVTQNGEYLANLPKGTIFRVAVQKAGYVHFVSEDTTLRDDPTQIDVSLQKGGTRLHVAVKSKENQLPLAGATISIYRIDGTLVESQDSPFTGELDFTGLSPDQNYFVGAFYDGYLPLTLAFSPLTVNEVTLELEQQTESNTADLQLFVTGVDGLAGNNADIAFSELLLGAKIPLGIPPAKTEYDGFVSVKVPLGKNISAKATRGLESGDANRFIEAGENNLAIRMALIDSAKLLRVLGLDGNPVPEAMVQIETPSGEILFDANLNSDGTTLFDAKASDIVNITVTVPDGNVFSSQENVKGKTEIIVQLRPNNEDSLSPAITFLGIENSDGSTIGGITPGPEYWLKFQVDWTSGEYRGGVHIRIGNDSQPFADSDDVGIVGFDAAGYSSFRYSRSFSPSPAPGNESADMANVGDASRFNKWLELYFENPKGTQIFRVKVKAKETIEKNAVFLHYRSWALVGASYYRNPSDPELKTEAFSASKTSLYAQAKEESIKVFSGTPDCVSEVCATFKIVSKNGETVSKSEFKEAARGQVYALEVSIRSQNALGGLLKATTPKQQPKVFFTGSEVESFTEFMDTNSTTTAIEINDLSVLEGIERKARIYFKPVQIGSASVTAEFLADNVDLKEEFFFTVFEQREMTVTVEPLVVSVGDPFKVLVMDDAGKPIENATVHIRDRLNAIVDTTVGNGTLGNGRGGEYAFSNSIGAGEFTAEVLATGFSPATVSFSISASDVLKLPEEIKVLIPMGQTHADYSSELENISGNVVRDIGVEILQDSAWPVDLTATAATSAALNARKKANLDIAADYIGGDLNKIVMGQADLVVKGFVAGKYPAVAKSRLVVSYNQELDGNCLEFDQPELVVYLAANPPFSGVNSLFSPSQYYQNYSNYNAPYNASFPNAADQTLYQNQFANPNQSIANAPANSDSVSSQDAGSSYGQMYNNANTNNQFNNQYGQYYNANSYYAPYSNTYAANGNQQATLEVSVKNNCNVALSLQSDVIPKNAVSKDPSIVIQTEPLVIQPNETLATTITVTNTQNRIIGAKEERNYDLVYSYNPSLTRVPLKVVLWDSRYSLAMNDNYVLYLSQGKKGEPVVSYAPVFARYLGLENIQNFNLHLAGDTYQNGVDIRIVPSGDVPLIKPNQVVYPPKVIVAELRGGTDKGRLVRAELVATGMINGREIELRRANIWVHVSALDCLRISAAESLDFINQESMFGAIDKKVRIRNTCEEPVRIVDISPNRLGANELTLVSLTTDVLQPDAEAEFLVRLVKRQDYKSQNLNVSVTGLSLLSQKFLSSNRVPLLVELGKSNASSVAATEPFQVNVCNPDGTISPAKTEIRFPKIASTANCDKSYCDAEMASEYLVKKLELAVNQAKQAISSGNAEAINFTDTCVVTAQMPACTFGMLDPKIPQTFDLFMQNDFVTTDLVTKTLLDKGGADLKNYAVNYCGTNQCDIRTIGATGYPNLLFLSQNFRGCGRYRVSVDGAAFVNQTQIRTDGFALSLNVQSFEPTAECANAVENVSNFLPLDKGLLPANGHLAWPGTVQAEERLLPLAEVLAKEYYGASEGRVSQNSSSNKIQVTTGELPAGIVRISIDPAYSLTEPKTVVATVNQSVEGVDLTENSQNAVAKEAGRAINSLKSRTIADGKGCISANHDYFVLGSATKLGDLSITGPDKVNVSPQNETCIDLKVNSELRENVRIQTNISAVLSQTNAFSQAVIRNKIDGRTLSETDTITLDEEPKTKKFTKDVQLCVTGSQYFVFSQSAPKFQVWSQSLIDAARRSKEKEIGYQACGIHPYDLANKLFSLEPNKEYFATVGWKGEPNTVTYSDLLNGMAKAKLLGEGKSQDTPGAASTEQQPVQAALKKRVLDSIWGPGSVIWTGQKPTNIGPFSSYLFACGGVSAACNGVRTVGMGGWLGGPLFDCVLPALWATAPYSGGVAKTVQDWLKGAGGSFSTWFGNIAGRVANFMGADFGTGDVADAQEQLSDAAVGFAGTKTLVHALLPYVNFQHYTKVPVKAAAHGIATDIVDELVKQKIKPASQIAVSGDIAKFKKLVMDELEPALLKSLEEKGTVKRGVTGRALIGNPSIAIANEKLLKEATEAGVTAAGAALDKSGKLYEFALTSDIFKDKPRALGKAQVIDTATKEFAETGKAIEPVMTGPQARQQLQSTIMTKLQGTYDFPAQITPTGGGAAVSLDSIVTAQIATAPLAEITLPGTTAPKKLPFKVANPEIQFQSVLNTVAGLDEKLVVEKIGKKIKTDAIKFAEELVKGQTGDVRLRTKIWKGITSLGRGLACSYASNAAGLKAFEAGMESPLDVQGDKLSVNGAPTADDSVGIITLSNGATYKVVVIPAKEKDGPRTVRVTKVDHLADIPKNASWLQSDCTGQFANRGLDEALNPDALAKTKIGAAAAQATPNSPPAQPPVGNPVSPRPQ